MCVYVKTMMLLVLLVDDFGSVHGDRQRQGERERESW